MALRLSSPRLLQARQDAKVAPSGGNSKRGAQADRHDRKTGHHPHWREGIPGKSLRGAGRIHAQRLPDAGIREVLRRRQPCGDEAGEGSNAPCRDSFGGNSYRADAR